MFACYGCATAVDSSAAASSSPSAAAAAGTRFGSATACGTATDTAEVTQPLKPAAKSSLHAKGVSHFKRCPVRMHVCLGNRMCVEEARTAFLY